MATSPVYVNIYYKKTNKQYTAECVFRPTVDTLHAGVRTVCNITFEVPVVRIVPAAAARRRPNHDARRGDIGKRRGQVDSDDRRVAHLAHADAPAIALRIAEARRRSRRVRAHKVATGRQLLTRHECDTRT